MSLIWVLLYYALHIFILHVYEERLKFWDLNALKIEVECKILNIF